jgi:predicted RNase H-like HicB family nuclease
LIAFKVEVESEDDGCWLAEVVELPGALAYGETPEAALSQGSGACSARCR